jgi:hypothetical protein
VDLDDNVGKLDVDVDLDVGDDGKHGLDDDVADLGDDVEAGLELGADGNEDLCLGIWSALTFST